MYASVRRYRVDPDSVEEIKRRVEAGFLPILEDIPGLFTEYIEASAIEERAFAAGVAGLVYMGSRPGNQLYRHNASYGIDNEHPMVVISRDAATRALRLIAAGTELTLKLTILNGVASVAELVDDIALGTANGPMRRVVPFSITLWLASNRVWVEGPPEPIIRPVRSFETSASVSPASFIAWVMAM